MLRLVVDNKSNEDPLHFVEMCTMRSSHVTGCM